MPRATRFEGYRAVSSASVVAVALGRNPVKSDAKVASGWWQKLGTVPPDVAGLWFGITTLVQQGQEQRTPYVHGMPTFDAGDTAGEWASDTPVWQARERHVVLPHLAAMPDQPYAAVLEHAAAVLRSFEPWRASGLGAAVGFDDGDLVVLNSR